MSPYEEANDYMLNKFALNRAYYVRMQSTQPAALPVPQEGDPLHLAGKPPSPAWLSAHSCLSFLGALPPSPAIT